MYGMKIVEKHSIGYVLGKALFSSPQRTISVFFVLFVLGAVPLTFYLANQQQDIRQQAADSTPACIFTPGTIRPGETSELLVVSYPYAPEPYMEPADGYSIVEKRGDTIIYKLDKPGTTWKISLLDPSNPMKNNLPNALASCTVSTTEY
jgi:hypothetical protein